MSVKEVNLAVIMRRAQKKNSEEDVIACKNILDELSEALEKDGLSSYFPTPLSEKEKDFLKLFFKTLRNNVETNENLVPVHLQCFLDLDLERAKALTFTFRIHLVDGSTSMLYLSWSKGIFDTE